MSPTYQVKHLEDYEDVSCIALIIWYFLDTTLCYLLCKVHKEFAISCVYLQFRYKCNSKSTGNAAGFQGLWLHIAFSTAESQTLKIQEVAGNLTWSVVMESF